MIVIKVSEVRKSRYAPKNEVYEFEVIKRQQEGYSGTKPNMVLNNEKVFAGYQIFGWGNGYRRKYKTRIPKSLNQFVENLLNQREAK